MVRLVFVLSLLLATGSLPAAGNAVPASTEDVVGKADEMLRAGRVEQAYRLLAPLEAQLAGDYRYDYLLGLSALDTGRYSAATFALERVVIARPRFAGARLDLARAYFAMGNYARARMEFERVSASQPPPGVRQVVERYVRAIESRSDPTALRLTGYGAVTVGHDSNVNAAPDLETLEVPLLPGVVWNLDGASRSQKDEYAQLSLGIGLQRRLKADVGLYASLDGWSRHLEEISRFDQDSFSGVAGVVLGQGTDIVKVGLHAGRAWLDQSVNRDAYGMESSWQHVSRAGSVWSPYARISVFRHRQETLEVNDFTQVLVGGTWLGAVGRSGASRLFWGAYLGAEVETERADGDKTLAGVTLGGETGLTATVSAYASAGYQAGRYEKENLAFQEKRADVLLSGSLGLNWALTRDWSVRAGMAYVKNDSNIAIDAYDRNETSITVRRDFR